MYRSDLQLATGADTKDPRDLLVLSLASVATWTRLKFKGLGFETETFYKTQFQAPQNNHTGGRHRFLPCVLSASCIFRWVFCFRASVILIIPFSREFRGSTQATGVKYI